MKLNFRTIGTGYPLIILHGVFGSSDNWQTLGKMYSEYFKVYLVDQRNHGLSPHSDDFNYELMSEDLKKLIQDEDLDKINIIGHSMGGKSAMHFSCLYPNHVNKLVVIDISPKFYPPHHDEIFKGFHAIDLNKIKSRKEADDRLAEIISDYGVRLFLLKNLSRNGNEEFIWKLNLTSIENNIAKIGQALPESYHFRKDTLFISGDQSDYINSEDHKLIYEHFPEAKIEIIENAGHWIHAEQPQKLFELTNAFLLN